MRLFRYFPGLTQSTHRSSGDTQPHLQTDDLKKYIDSYNSHAKAGKNSWTHPLHLALFISPVVLFHPADLPKNDVTHRTLLAVGTIIYRRWLSTASVVLKQGTAHALSGTSVMPPEFRMTLYASFPNFVPPHLCSKIGSTTDSHFE